MPTNMKFGECLRYLLSIFEVSIAKLSKVINVDNSLVNRWVNEKRTPAYNTDYVEKISEYLSGCILNSYQLQYLDEFFIKVCGDYNIEIDTKEKIKKILLQAQGYSIEYKKNLPKENKNLFKVKKTLKEMNTNNVDLLNAQDSDLSINLSSEDKILVGWKKCVIRKYFFIRSYFRL
ncbi:helix-turn-helix transcriptional regulator [Ruminiclostridium josui]|uniref:helix-turn-helix transcriptional regulator n=1 Tax=Ruminiclostridium josui TaxID=1499 RepID=UPI0006D2572A|nr:helix-turn-helix transcriptional regulator [Ruminiclostridium josui]